MQSVILISLLCTIVTATTAQSYADPTQGYSLEMMDLLGVADRPQHFKRHVSLRNSASKFLLEIYDELNEEEKAETRRSRKKRSSSNIDNFITKLDRLEMQKCNNIITFSSKKSNYERQILSQSVTALDVSMALNFNTNNVPSDLKLVYSTLRIYQDPTLGKYHDQLERKTTISLFHRHYNRQQQTSEFRLYASINSTTAFKGWLEFNTTRLLTKWLKRRTIQQTVLGNDVLLSVALHTPGSTPLFNEIDAGTIGIVKPSATGNDLIDLQPFLIGYFTGPELMSKIQKMRLKREAGRYKRLPFLARGPPKHQENYHHPKSCERFNFTLDFRDLKELTQHIIAPKKFEAYFCGGECNFPLGASMKPSNHAIVQTLVHMKVNANIPKPCCVPTVYGNILILEYINDHGFNLRTYKQSVAKECGCH